MKTMAATVFLALVLAPVSGAQITKPIRHTWIATSCETWNCAASALILANGDKHVIALPTGTEDRPWVLLRRVEEGSIFIPDDEPFSCEVFDTLTLALSRFDGMDRCHGPLILNVPDGRAVVAALRRCESPGKRRAIR